MNVVDRDGFGRGLRYAVIAVLCLPVLLLLLSACAPVPDPSAGLSVEETVKLIEQVAPSDLSPQTVAEAFALGSRATDVQREDLTQALVGHSVEWDIPVFDVALEEGRFTVTSQTLPITDTNATPLLRVMVFVVPTSEADDALLRAVKTGDVLRVRGIVQEIRVRTFVMVVPGVVVGPTDKTSGATQLPKTIHELPNINRVANSPRQPSPGRQIRVVTPP